ncbi:unnamed protein product [Effrenium voratum]|uniref:Uncharacterized protein n=1 Tax=Effrenium voratum TaxID=2562239 RepID=A0AA36J678_9DINO|nr:unnamed protein product [Effrenium voratum]CAJ1441748.1 unnamed protein product [Effrenium voratum]
MAPQVPSAQVCTGLEVEPVEVCGLSFRILRRRSDFFAAVAGDLPVSSTGLVLWECAILLAEYLGYAGWTGGYEDRNWWQLHPPAAVVPARFWRRQRAVLELGGGAGLVCAALTSLGAQVVYTDGDPAALRTAELNLANAWAQRRKRGKEGWGSCTFRRLSFGDEEAARKIVEELGPFGHVVGSDLLYGDRAPPEPLLDTLAALARAQDALGEPFLVTIAIKNRCCDEVEVFAGAARQRGLWAVSRAEPAALPESFQVQADEFYGRQAKPGYCVVHLRPAEPDPSRSAKRARVSEAVASPAPA